MTGWETRIADYVQLKKNKVLSTGDWWGVHLTFNSHRDNSSFGGDDDSL